MRERMWVAALSTSVLLSLSTPCRSPAQVLAKTLLFNSVQPCRVADTRSAAAGILLGGVPRTFNVVGATTNYGSQGGVSGGCGIPGFVAGLPQVQAVAVNIVAVDPSGDGFLTAWPTDQAFPPASTVNFQKLVPNLNIANGVIVPVRQNAQGGDITVVAGVSNAHVIIDITGYFSKAEPRKYYLTTASTFSGGQALTACAAGYHMAALTEIFDTASLRYNTALGGATQDGLGPPIAFGWIRTGTSSSNAATLGSGNCFHWTSNSAGDNGSVVLPYAASWGVASVAISPWNGITSPCSMPRRVWCVED